MQHQKTSGLLMLISLLVFICGCDPYASRDCPGFNYDISKWGGYENLDTIKFSTMYGERLTFIKEEVFKTEPMIQGNLGANCPEEVICELYATFIYRLETDAIDLKIQFRESEDWDMDVNEEFVMLSYSFHESISDEFINGHGFTIEPLILREESGKSQIEMLEHNGKTYHNVIKSLRDSTRESVNPAFDFWEIFLVKGEGIIKMRNRNMEEYYRIE